MIKNSSTLADQPLSVSDDNNKMVMLSSHIRNCIPIFLCESWEDETCLFVASNLLWITCVFLRGHSPLKMDTLVSISALDMPSSEGRFTIVYEFLSSRSGLRLRIKTEADTWTSLPSLTQVYPASSWMEREVWDLYGVFFSDHDDLRRIITDYGFDGHPLRKDYPLSGFTELRYDEDQQVIVAENISLSQEFRSFDFKTPWS